MHTVGQVRVEVCARQLRHVLLQLSKYSTFNVALILTFKSNYVFLAAIL